MAQRAPTIVIVGGGITGLAAGYWLQQKANACQRPIDLKVLEREEQVGGKLQTEHHNGFIIEQGPDIFLARKPRGIGLCEALGLSNQIQGTNPAFKGSYIQHKGQLHPLPSGFSGLLPANVWSVLGTPLLSLAAKLRLALEPLIPRRKETTDESLGHFIQRRLGRETYTRLVHPLLSGIYGGDIEQISLQATFPQFQALEQQHGSLIRGLRAKKSAPAGPNYGSAFVTLKDGMGSLPKAVAAQLGDAVRCKQDVTAVHRTDPTFRIERARQAPLAADAVLVTTPAYHAADLVQSLSPDLAASLGAIPYTSTMTVTLGYDKADVPRPLDAYGYLVPASEGKLIRACTWSSSKIEGRAPKGSVLIRVFVGRSQEEPCFALSDDALLAAISKELHETLGIATQPQLVRIRRWLRAMPAYVMGHLERLTEIDEALADQPGLFVAGAAYRGVGIPDSIQDGERAAAALWSHIKQHDAFNTSSKPFAVTF